MKIKTVGLMLLTLLSSLHPTIKLIGVHRFPPFVYPLIEYLRLFKLKIDEASQLCDVLSPFNLFGTENQCQKHGKSQICQK